MKTDLIADLTTERVRDLYRRMITIRLFEEKIVEVYGLQEMKTPVHLYLGQEAVAAGVCANLSDEDYVFGTHRSHGLYLAKGGDMNALMAELYGRRTGCSKGKGGSMHVIDTQVGVCGTSAIVGGNIPLAVGAALGVVMQGQGRVAAAFFGDGAVDEGVFYESLNFAALKRLPVIFVCENNFYATASHQSKRQPADRINRLSQGHLIPGLRLDGNDVLAVNQAAGKAVARAREGKGPTLLECRTYRWKGHVGPGGDVEKGCRPRAELDAWLARCPVKTFEEFITAKGLLNPVELELIREQVSQAVEEAHRFGRESPYPEPDELLQDVWG